MNTIVKPIPPPVENQSCECRSCMLKGFVHIDDDKSIESEQELSKENQIENPKEEVYECEWVLSETKCGSIESRWKIQMTYVNDVVDGVIETLEQEYAEAQRQIQEEEEPPQCICADGYEDKRRCKYCTES